MATDGLKTTNAGNQKNMLERKAVVLMQERMHNALLKMSNETPKMKQ